jgi:hypothetical protein
VHPMTYEALVAARRADMERSAAVEARRAGIRQRRRATRRPLRVALGMGLIALGLRLVDLGSRRRRKGAALRGADAGGLPVDGLGACRAGDPRLIGGA